MRGGSERLGMGGEGRGWGHHGTPGPISIEGKARLRVGGGRGGARAHGRHGLREWHSPVDSASQPTLPRTMSSISTREPGGTLNRMV